MIYIQSFIKIGTGIQAILRICLSSSRGYNIGNTEGGIYDVRHEMSSGGMMYTLSSMTISSSIYVTLRLLLQQFERM
jgi:hypothetical protein